MTLLVYVRIINYWPMVSYYLFSIGYMLKLVEWYLLVTFFMDCILLAVDVVVSLTVRVYYMVFSMEYSLI